MTILIGLLGGTFDPVHNGHIAVARHVRDGLDMDQVRFILNAVPPHRVSPAASIDHRLAMLERALAGERRLIADTRELERTGPSYSVWTLRSLRREYPEASLCWIVGADAFAGLRSWHRWWELSSLAHILVVKRPGWDSPAEAVTHISRGTRRLRQSTAGETVLWKGPQVDVSASAIRRRIGAGLDVPGMLPQPVWRYIERQGLYDYH